MASSPPSSFSDAGTPRQPPSGNATEPGERPRDRGPEAPMMELADLNPAQPRPVDEEPDVFVDAAVSTLPSSRFEEEPLEDPLPAFSAASTVAVIAEYNFSGHSGAITQCRFSSSGSLAASASTDGTVKIWNVQRPMRLRDTVPASGQASILSLCWHTDDRYVLSGSSQRKIKLYDVEKKHTAVEFSTPSDFSRVVALASSPGISHFAVAAVSEPKKSLLPLPISKRTDALPASYALGEFASGYLATMNLKTMKPEHVFVTGCAVGDVAYNHNGTMLLTACADGNVRIYDTKTNTCIMDWRAHSAEVSSVMFADDYNSVVSFGRDGQVCVWGLRKAGKQLSCFAADPLSSARSPYPTAMSQIESQLCAVASGRKSALIFQMQDGALCAQAGSHTRPICAVDWCATLADARSGGVRSAASSAVLTGAVDGSLRLTELLVSRAAAASEAQPAVEPPQEDLAADSQ
eukprot:TRINITY_DN4975_c0_g1_i1.p1 TRINITY_DN4975_c0_g1~~TRINITY_DN4975_c0_g1_i1.p1  ORF type:complete len:463 (+),score=80.19 TRINITY_DN4975_c0_g1_i1:815-2203(+)